MSMSKNRIRTEQGGITLQANDATFPLSAATFTHAALPGRTIVKLVPEPLLEAETLSLAVSGIEFQTSTPVGHIQRRGTGFPAWPILTDPKNAQHALNLVADLKHATRRVKSKPGATKIEIVELADKLEDSAPHFLPTFLEEAARAYFKVGDTRHAAQMFTRAREIERRYAVPIDETRHRDVFMEFAYAGAISGKELTAEATSLSQRLKPAEAFEAFRTLCIECVRGGLSPYSGLKKDLAKLARAAGLKPAEEEARLVPDLLRIGSIQRAQNSFWKNYYPAIRKAATQDAEVRELLLTLTPEEANPDEWIELLQKTGALEAVKQGTHPEFVARIVNFASQRKGTDSKPSAKLAPLLAEILPHAGCTSVTLPWKPLTEMPPEAFEQLAANNVKVEPDRRDYTPSINVAHWANSENKAALPHLVVDEQYRQYLINGIVQNRTHPGVMSAVAADPHLHPLVIELLTAKVELLEATSPTVDRLVEVTSFARSFEETDDAEVQALLDRVRAYHKDPADVLAETLRRGLLEELGWPEYEDACSSKELPDSYERVDSQDCWPGVVVYNRDEATYLCGRTSQDIPNWTGNRITGATEVDGQFAILNWDTNIGQYYINWSTSGARLLAQQPSRLGDRAGGSVPVPGGRLTGIKTIIRPDQPTWSRPSNQFFVEEDRIWMVQSDETIVEINPDTGAKGRQSMPGWFEEQCRRHPDLIFNPTRSQLRPVTKTTADSPFSTADGYHRHAVFTDPDDRFSVLIIDADGAEYPIKGISAHLIRGVICLPGGQPRILIHSVTGNALLHPEDGATTSYYGTQFKTDLWWHHTYPRDPQLSARLRTITADEVRPVLEIVAKHPRYENDEELPREILDEISEGLALSTPALCSAVIRQAHNLLESWPQQSDAANSPHTLLGAPTFEQHPQPVTSLLDTYWAKIDVAVLWRSTAALGLHEYPVRQTETSTSSGFSLNNEQTWSQLLGATDGLLALAALPGRTAEEIQGLKELWLVLREAGVAGAEDLVVDNIEQPADFILDNPFGYPSSVLISNVFTRPMSLLRKATNEPVIINGKQFPLVNRREISPGRTDLEPVFDALLERVNKDGPLPWSPEPGIKFAEAARVPVTDAHLIMAGFPYFSAFEANFLPKELRTTMGLKVKEATEARKRLNEFQEDFLSVLAAGVPGNPAMLVEHGLDIHAMATRWPGRESVLDPDLPESLDRLPGSPPEKVAHSLLTGTHNAEAWSKKVTALLWLAQELDLSEESRTTLADYAEGLVQSPDGLDNVNIGSIMNDAHLERTLGLTLNDALQSSRFRVQETGWRYLDLLYADLTGIDDLEHPDLQLARRWCTENYGDLGKLTALDWLLSGKLSSYAQWLRKKYDGGDPHDPLAVVPQLVAEVSTTLGVSENAARYYLQLLAWPDPTDANVRRWNSWQKADITAAGRELSALDLVVEAKRPRSRRSFFLQGGWAEAVAPHLPLESWKVEPLAFRPNPSGSKYEPALGVAVAPLPPPEWFAECWQRCQGEDAPQFSELTTTRRKR